MGKIDVLILMGSPSDMEIMKAASRVLDEFGVSHRVEVASAHRNPDRVRELVREASDEGCSVFIAGAGWAAHLAGPLRSHRRGPEAALDLPRRHRLVLPGQTGPVLPAEQDRNGLHAEHTDRDCGGHSHELRGL